MRILQELTKNLNSLGYDVRYTPVDNGPSWKLSLTNSIGRERTGVYRVIDGYNVQNDKFVSQFLLLMYFKLIEGGAKSGIMTEVKTERLGAV